MVSIKQKMVEYCIWICSHSLAPHYVINAVPIYIAFS